ncbi:hypothetical protein FB451DRAFT_1279991 [Mycena latifolia]|nr:hypothetical protein FB451DRAFT_1279991 [Mycena latifolia]
MSMYWAAVAGPVVAVAGDPDPPIQAARRVLRRCVQRPVNFSGEPFTVKGTLLVARMCLASSGTCASPCPASAILTSSLTCLSTPPSTPRKRPARAALQLPYTQRATASQQGCDADDLVNLNAGAETTRPPPTEESTPRADEASVPSGCDDHLAQMTCSPSAAQTTCTPPPRI